MEIEYETNGNDNGRKIIGQNIILSKNKDELLVIYMNIHLIQIKEYQRNK